MLQLAVLAAGQGVLQGGVERGKLSGQFLPSLIAGLGVALADLVALVVYADLIGGEARELLVQVVALGQALQDEFRPLLQFGVHELLRHVGTHRLHRGVDLLADEGLELVGGGVAAAVAVRPAVFRQIAAGVVIDVTVRHRSFLREQVWVKTKRLWLFLFPVSTAVAGVGIVRQCREQFLAVLFDRLVGELLNRIDLMHFCVGVG